MLAIEPYKKIGVTAMEFKRDIYQKLVQWKNGHTGLVLEVFGVRQVGKTYI